MKQEKKQNSKGGQKDMKKNLKRFISIIMVMAMAFAMAAGCGKKEEAATDKEEPKTEATAEDQAESEDEATDDVAEPEEEETAGEVNEYGIVENDLYDSIKNSVLHGYLEPNNISPADFKWPEYEEGNDGSFHDEDYLWTYLFIIFDNYMYGGRMYDATDFPVEIPERKQLMDSVLDGIAAWYELPENKEISVISIEKTFNPLNETIPANVNFAE